MNYAAREDKVFELTGEYEIVDEAQAELELARRYFSAYGPATIHDAMYFFHATAARVKGWLKSLPVSSFEWDARCYYFIETG